MNIIYSRFRASVLRRDLYRCAVCLDDNGDMHVHVIGHPDSFACDGHVRSNGITLCDKCQRKALDVTEGVEFHHGYTPGDLWKITGGNYLDILEACEKLALVQE